jgi:hypothetical protein
VKSNSPFIRKSLKDLHARPEFEAQSEMFAVQAYAVIQKLFEAAEPSILYLMDAR